MQTITINGKRYEFHIFTQDLTIKKNMCDPCSKCDIGRDNYVCKQINCITGDNFYYLKEKK